MQSERIRALIEEGKKIEGQTGLLRRAIVNLAKVNGVHASDETVQGTVAFIVEYIEHAPALMQVIREAVADDAALQDIQPILDATEDYFLDPDDVIPDQFGLVGLVDDAYMTHCLMQAVSDRHKSATGVSLLPVESHEINAFVGRLIGEPFVSMLDEHVAATLDGPVVRENIDQMLVVLSQLNLAASPDPIWGDERGSEITTARLGPMGAF